VLALEYVAGGELFDLINSDESHAALHEPLLRRVFGELAKAVAWMHGVGLVHRDIKLESAPPARGARARADPAQTSCSPPTSARATCPRRRSRSSS
jgi:serine/threonine protein kinase